MSIWLTAQERATINKRLRELEHRALVSLGFQTSKEQEHPEMCGVSIHVEGKRASQSVKDIGTGHYRCYVAISVGMEKVKLFYEKKDGLLDTKAISNFVSEAVKKTLAKREETNKLDDQLHKNEEFVRKEFKGVGIKLDEDSVSEYANYNGSFNLTLSNLDRESFSIALKTLMQAGILERHTRSPR